MGRRSFESREGIRGRPAVSVRPGLRGVLCRERGVATGSAAGWTPATCRQGRLAGVALGRAPLASLPYFSQVIY